MTPRRRRQSRCGLEREDDHFTSKMTHQSIEETDKAEGVLKGEGLPLGVLGVGGRHGNAGERAAMPRRAAYSCSIGIIFFCILIVMQNK